MKKDCIYYGGIDEDMNMHVCLNSGSLYEDDEMCRLCRLWDAYTPNTANDQEIKKAKEWQNMPYGKQPPYEDFF